MKTKKIISIILTVLLMFSFCSFSVSAADGTGEFDTEDIFTTAYIITESSEYINVTSNVTVDNVSSGTFKGFKKYSVPILQNDVVKTQVQLTFEDKFTMRSDHEYNLKFQWGYRLGVPCTMEINLYIRDTAGTLIKTQKILTVDSPGNSKIQNVDCNFTPSISDIESGYTCNFVIRLTQNYFESSTGSPQEFFVSPTVSLTDLDDNSGLINSIIEAIKAIPDRIKGFFTDLADNIKGFFDSLKNYILYFQDPVTLNEDGVLVDANGNPIYVNPFENSIEDIEETFNGWIEDIRGFISGMDESRVQVSGYLQTGTGLINDVLSASPIISAVLIFIASFFVIRKVVGR